MNSGDRLRALLDDLPSGGRRPVLSEADARLLRSLRTQGERAVRGRLVTRYAFDALARPGGTSLAMRIEGRHAMSVAQQLAKRFSMVEDVESAEVTRTERGAVLELRPREAR
jgi:hypothetical protein